AHIALSNIDELDDFQGGEEYRQATIDFINNYIELAKNEYTEFIEKYYLPDELFTDEILDRCLEILMDIDEKYNASFDKLTEIQEEFAKLYHFDLEVRK
ncbi:MAG: hypothetical protein GX879_04235, partial [Bacteroidales bacterium]|nr:hypothetical protein [Bacteroidales bacterium]